jgi:hypothetical protein
LHQKNGYIFSVDLRPFCVVDFVDLCNIDPIYIVNYPAKGGDQPTIYKVFFPKVLNYLRAKRLVQV